MILGDTVVIHYLEISSDVEEVDPAQWICHQGETELLAPVHRQHLLEYLKTDVYKQTLKNLMSPGVMFEVLPCSARRWLVQAAMTSDRSAGTYFRNISSGSTIWTLVCPPVPSNSMRCYAGSPKSASCLHNTLLTCGSEVSSTLGTEEPSSGDGSWSWSHSSPSPPTLTAWSSAGSTGLSSSSDRSMSEASRLSRISCSSSSDRIGRRLREAAETWQEGVAEEHPESTRIVSG